MLLKKASKKVKHYLDIIINDFSLNFPKYSILKLLPTTEKTGVMVTSSNNGRTWFQTFSNNGRSDGFYIMRMVKRRY